MMVRDLIKLLEDMPQYAPVVTDYHEIENVIYEKRHYTLTDAVKDGYIIEPAVVLE